MKEVLLWSAAEKAGWGPRKSRGPDSQAGSVCGCLFARVYLRTCDETHSTSHQMEPSITVGVENPQTLSQSRTVLELNAFHSDVLQTDGRKILFDETTHF